MSVASRAARKRPPFAPIVRRTLRKAARRATAAALTAGVLFLPTQIARAGTDTWTGGGADANWTTAGNWAAPRRADQTGANIFSGGATINTNALNLTVSQALLAPAGNGLSSVSEVSGGSRYQTAPIIKITGGGGTGTTAVASVTDGVITGITITNPGTSSAPLP